ncbi:MAG: UDP-N-acetylmuramate dehydrogenase [Treponema sp.]|jgi:UDP-N-acetylmuramate dehydrogenase|nr:UDP-N-acetylmuramate dehydrogenase [Treponema sp.]
MEKINTETGFTGQLRYDEPMAGHTTFKVGGPADVWVRPQGDCFPEYATILLGIARSEGIPVFILGAGANLVVSDQGIRGIVLDTSAWAGCDFFPDDSAVLIRSGTVVDDAVSAAAGQDWGGLEFLAGMPGSIGGALWMNARCYEKSVSDVLLETNIIDESWNQVRLPFNAADYGYKKSPFQGRTVLILSARFTLHKRSRGAIRRDMDAYCRDRESKGHYRFPSAGSAFKNNRAFGKPTGQLIDELGLRGLIVGGAAVAPWHGNIIINTGIATATDIRVLVELIMQQTKAALGLVLEPELLFVGDWEDKTFIRES